MSDRLEEIKAREAKATPPPWTAREKCDGPYFRYAADGEQINETGFHVREIDKLGNHESGAMVEADAVFCAHARWDVPYLIKLVEAATSYIAADQAYDVALRHADYRELDKQMTARDAALWEWRDAKGEGPKSWPISSVQLPLIREDAAKGGT